MAVALAAWRLLLASLILLAARGAGALLLRKVDVRQSSSSPGVGLLLELSLGLGVLAYTILALGIAGALHPAVFWVLLLATALVGAAVSKWSLSEAVGHAFDGVCRVWSIPRWLGWLLIGAGVALAILNLIGALSPPLNPDDLRYHFVGPQRYLRWGGVEFIPDKYYTNLPFTMEMVWTAAISLGGGVVAQVVNWAIGLLTVAWVAVLVRGADFDLEYASIAAVLFYSITTVGQQSRTGNVELGATLFFLAAVYLLVVRLRQGREGSWGLVMLAGLLGGFHAGTKLLNALFVIVVTIWFSWSAWKLYNWSQRQVLRATTIFALTALATAGVWYAKNWVMTGNPVYPFLYSVFGGPPMRTHLLGVDIGTHGEMWVNSLTREFFLYRLISQPVRLLADPSTLRGHVGPVWIAYVPVGLWLARKWLRSKVELTAMCLLAGLFYLVWVPSYRVVRIGLPFFALLAPVLSLALIQALQRGPVLRWLTSGVVALWLATSVTAAVSDVHSAIPVVAGAESKDAYLERVGPRRHSYTAHDAIRFMNHSLPPDSKVLLWGSRGYYLEHDYLFALEFIASMADSARIYDPEEVLSELKRHGITHVAMNDNYLRRPLKEALESSGGLKCLFRGETMRVCALESSSAHRWRQEFHRSDSLVQRDEATGQ